MIRVEHLSKSYGAVKALDQISFATRQGVITGLAGPNACGKTTLIKSILGLVVPSAGKIFLGNVPITNDFRYREQIGYMQQNAEFPANLRPSELFRMLSTLRGSRSARLDELITIFALEPSMHKPFATLSAGTRQKVAATAALLFEPPLLILDEPTAGLDPLASARLKHLLLKAAKDGATILMVSHIMTELEQLISDLVFLLDGHVLFSGEVGRLRSETNALSLEAGIVTLLETTKATEKGRL